MLLGSTLRVNMDRRKRTTRPKACKTGVVSLDVILPDFSAPLVVWVL